MQVFHTPTIQSRLQNVSPRTSHWSRGCQMAEVKADCSSDLISQPARNLSAWRIPTINSKNLTAKLLSHFKPCHPSTIVFNSLIMRMHLHLTGFAPTILIQKYGCLVLPWRGSAFVNWYDTWGYDFYSYQVNPCKSLVPACAAKSSLFWVPFSRIHTAEPVRRERMVFVFPDYDIRWMASSSNFSKVSPSYPSHF